MGEARAVASRHVRTIHAAVLVEGNPRPPEPRRAGPEVRAPVDGIVHASRVHTIGAVLGQDETVLEIVPDREPLIIEARVTPTSIDNVQP